jgi:proline iminopeptidase
MLTYFPSITPYSESYIRVGKPLVSPLHQNEYHELSIKQYGNPDGIPVIYLHGGPGVGCPPQYATYFDPNEYRIILFDQRGAGDSRPQFCIEQNTTIDLIEDVETIRSALNLKKPLLYGGSWGSALALLVAERYPDNYGGLILRGIFLADSEDISVILHEDSKAVSNNPEEWLNFKRIAFPENPEAPKNFDEIISTLYERARVDDANIWQPVASAMARWEAVNCSVDPKDTEERVAGSYLNDGMTTGRMLIHYSAHNFWLTESQILNNVHKLSHLPIYIVQGQLDEVTPPYQAEKLVNQLSMAKAPCVTVYRTHAGHSAGEAANVDALIQSTKDYSAKINLGIYNVHK